MEAVDSFIRGKALVICYQRSELRQKGSYVPKLNTEDLRVSWEVEVDSDAGSRYFVSLKSCLVCGWFCLRSLSCSQVPCSVDMGRGCQCLARRRRWVVPAWPYTLRPLHPMMQVIPCSTPQSLHEGGVGEGSEQETSRGKRPGTDVKSTAPHHQKKKKKKKNRERI